MMTAVKGQASTSGTTVETYWNGKAYTSGYYVTVTRPGGKQYKVQYDPRGQGNRKYEYPMTWTDLEGAKNILKSVGIEVE